VALLKTLHEGKYLAEYICICAYVTYVNHFGFRRIIQELLLRFNWIVLCVGLSFLSKTFNYARYFSQLLVSLSYGHMDFPAPFIIVSHWHRSWIWLSRRKKMMNDSLIFCHRRLPSFNSNIVFKCVACNSRDSGGIAKEGRSVTRYHGKE
jgi:hypothetical protein